MADCECGKPIEVGYYYLVDEFGNIVKCYHEFQQGRMETDSETS